MKKFLSCDIILSLSVRQHGAIIEQQRGQLVVPLSDRLLWLWKWFLIILLAVLLVFGKIVDALFRSLIGLKDLFDQFRLGLFIVTTGVKLCLVVAVA